MRKLADYAAAPVGIDSQIRSFQSKKARSTHLILHLPQSTSIMKRALLTMMAMTTFPSTTRALSWDDFRVKFMAELGDIYEQGDECLDGGALVVDKDYSMQCEIQDFQNHLFHHPAEPDLDKWLNFFSDYITRINNEQGGVCQDQFDMMRLLHRVENLRTLSADLTESTGTLSLWGSQCSRSSGLRIPVQGPSQSEVLSLRRSIFKNQWSQQAIGVLKTQYSTEIDVLTRKHADEMTSLRVDAEALRMEHNTVMDALRREINETRNTLRTGNIAINTLMRNNSQNVETIHTVKKENDRLKLDLSIAVSFAAIAGAALLLVVMVVAIRRLKRSNTEKGTHKEELEINEHIPTRR